MDSIKELLKEAESYQPDKADLDAYKEIIATLRGKGTSWREIANFLNTKAGINVEHTKLARFSASLGLEKSLSDTIPSLEEYASALSRLDMSDDELTMLRCHFESRNRTVTYSQLASSISKDDYRVANKIYGELSKKICAETGFKPFPSASGRPFYGSVMGMKYAYASPKDEFQLVMHHELSRAIEQLKLF